MVFTLFIILITVLCSVLAFFKPGIMRVLAFSPYLVSTKGQYYRFFSNGFIHYNFIHLAVNMTALYIFGIVIEKYYIQYFSSMAYVYYAVLYLLGIAVSDLPVFFKKKHDPTFFSLGASGGVSAIIFSAILIRPSSSICLGGEICFPAYLFGMLYLLYTFYSSKKLKGNVNHEAHLVGAVFGFLFSIILKPKLIASFINQIIDFKMF